MGKKTLAYSFGISDYGGASNTLTTDNYVGGPGSTAPTNQIYLNIGSVTSTNMTSGMWVTIDLDVVADFFEYSLPPT